MRYNFPHFRIDRSDFLKGGNTYDDYPDAGIIYSSVGYNSFKKPGFLTVSPDIIGDGTSKDPNLPTGVGISFARGKNGLSQETVCIGTNASSDGYFYTMNDATGSLSLVGSADTVNNYTKGKCTTVFYHGNYYTTSDRDITLNVPGLTAVSRNVSWWQTTKTMAPLDGNSPHPQVVFGDIHYIADGQYIHQNDNGTTQYNVFDLGPDWVITAMEVYNNLIYIAAEPYYNFSGTYHGLAKIFTWNGYAVSWLDEYLVENRISSMIVFKNILYVFMKNYFAYFNGSIVKNLYPVANQIYQHQVTSTSDSIWFADGTTVIRYGSPYPTGQYRFHRYFSTVSLAINGITSPAYESLFLATTGSTNGSDYFTTDVNTPTASGSKSISATFNKRMFVTPVKIRGVVVQLRDQLTASPTQAVGIGYINDEDVSKTKNFTGGNATQVGQQRWRFDFFSQPASRRIQPFVTIQVNAYIEWIDFLYEGSEDMLNA